MHLKEELSALRRPGNGLLSQVLRHSTIGARAFDGRVRDGIGSDRSAKVTRPAKRGKEANWFYDRLIVPSPRAQSMSRKSCSTFSKRTCSNSLTRAVPCRSRDSTRSGKCSERGDGHRVMRAFKPIELLVPVSCTHCCASTPGLSTWSSSTALEGELV